MMESEGDCQFSVTLAHVSDNLLSTLEVSC